MSSTVQQQRVQPRTRERGVACTSEHGGTSSSPAGGPAVMDSGHTGIIVPNLRRQDHVRPRLVQPLPQGRCVEHSQAGRHTQHGGHRSSDPELARAGSLAGPGGTHKYTVTPRRAGHHTSARPVRSIVHGVRPARGPQRGPPNRSLTRRVPVCHPC